jgi:hypothetical protein
VGNSDHLSDDNFIIGIISGQMNCFFLETILKKKYKIVDYKNDLDRTHVEVSEEC